jgi:hypothetical protein
VCNALRLDDMHASLPDLKYRSPPLWCSIVIGCLCLLSKVFFAISMYWSIHVLVIHSTVNTAPILGYLWWLLVSLFIKLDNAPKCGVAWFIIKELNKSFISWILSRIVLCLAVCILPALIKRFSGVVLILDC